MGEIVNLRRARKARDRRDAEVKAKENRAVFGRPKSESALTSARIAHQSAQLDAHRRDRRADAGSETRPET